MKNIAKKFPFAILLVLAVFLLIPALASAHTPITVTSNEITVTNPEVSKAYYAEMKSKPQTYFINSDQPFDLYVNLLVPDIQGQEQNTIAQIIRINKDINTETVLASLEGTGYKWTSYFEPFGSDQYWKGPEFKQAQAPAGEYQIRVRSPHFDGKYALAIGEKEDFTIGSTFGSIGQILKNKKEFFGKSPISFIFSPIGWGYLILMFALAFGVGFLVHWLMRKYGKNDLQKLHKNLGEKDRLIRAGIGIVLLAIALFTTWNAILIFLAGFMIFQAVFSWCIVYRIMGKNTCSVE